MLSFMTLTQCRVKTINAMGKEMRDYFIGPMPVEEFLQEFFPSSEIPDYDPLYFTSAFAAGAFSDVISIKHEERAYTPFINAIKPFTPQLSFVNTHNHADTQNCSKINSTVFNIKPDICVYPDGCAPSSPNCDVSSTEIIIKFKWSYSHDAFCEPSGVDSVVSQTERGMDMLGQIASYTAAQLGTQEGAIVTGPINYNNQPHLANSFHHYARASPEMCGVDTSITLANDEDADLARSQLNIPSTTCMFKVEVSNAEGSGLLTLVIP
ncbi:uncharacterized protein HD556DRAFT_1440621 [Suillus plorans]|uniref:Uncharacterized protein n=1 Tax=Suillus plorans TaxID=116603 RepID=A0A9P7IZM0_9AGAM|nr:uncharacterized protein HD556DRAFT_1440621 [Suillus plorans]KAG1798281.1 hypothetical protein HD556DRAFT_1440621 [Suillus plorans]